MSWPTADLDTLPAHLFTVKDDSFINSDGYKIVTRAWIPKEISSGWKALVFMCHGYLEHCRVPYYDILAAIFVAEGCYVFTHDLVGHGESGGTRATVKSFDNYVDDILQHADLTRKKFSYKPIYLFGHSMGGLLVALAVQRRPVDFAGIIMASPLLAPHKALMPWYKKLATKILGRVLPSVPIAALDLALYARDPDVLSYMASDPLRFHGNIPLVWPAALFKAQDDFAARLSYIQVPILLQVPSDDRVCDVAAMKKFFDALPSKYKEMKIYEGSYHSIFAEPEGIKEQAFNDVAEWLRERLLAVKLHTSHSQTGTTVASTPTSFSNSEV